MTLRQSLRALYHCAAELVPWQLVRTVRGRDYDAAVLAAADALAEHEEQFETYEPLASPPYPPVGVGPAADDNPTPAAGHPDPRGAHYSYTPEPRAVRCLCGALFRNYDAYKTHFDNTQ